MHREPQSRRHSNESRPHVQGPHGALSLRVGRAGSAGPSSGPEKSVKADETGQ